MNNDRQILVNGRYLHQRLTGVQRYADEVLSCLGEQVKTIAPPQSFSRGLFWEQVYLPTRVRRGDLLWSPTNTGPLLVRSQVVTIHDLSPLDHPEWFDRKFSTWYRVLLPSLARRVRHIISDSQFSKSRIIELLGVAEAKVTVIHLGVSDSFQPITEGDAQLIRERYSLNKPFILAVGSIEPRKNLKRLIEAWKKIYSYYSDSELILVGSKGYPFKDPGIEGELPGVRFLGRIPDQDLPAMYGASIALVYPSVYEGFGLPVLEAMACGTPVIASNAASLPETGGEAVVYFNPLEVDSIASTLRQVLDDKALRMELQKKGLERANRFSWNKTAEQVWAVLKNALEECSP